MIEDKLLMWRLKYGSKEALCRIYEKYDHYLLVLATGLLNHRPDAEDVVHDVFVSLAQSAAQLKLGGNLKGYLSACVINHARDLIRERKRRSLASIHEISLQSSNSDQVTNSAELSEEIHRLNRSLARLPDEQREVIVLRAKGEMTFRQIAQLQNVSVNTAQGRYRYGLAKLRSLLDGEVSYEIDR